MKGVSGVSNIADPVREILASSRAKQRKTHFSIQMNFAESVSSGQNGDRINAAAMHSSRVDMETIVLSMSLGLRLNTAANSAPPPT